MHINELPRPLEYSHILLPSLVYTTEHRAKKKSCMCRDWRAESEYSCSITLIYVKQIRLRLYHGLDR